MVAVEISVKLKNRLEIIRAAGAIADFRITQTSGRTLIEIQPGDSLEGEELHDFVAEMMETTEGTFRLLWSPPSSKDRRPLKGEYKVRTGRKCRPPKPFT